MSRLMRCLVCAIIMLNLNAAVAAQSAAVQQPQSGDTSVNGRTLVISAWTIAIAISLMNVFLIYQQFFLN